jgi:hypothetical protein
MSDERSVWPMDVTHPTSRPSAFRPFGYLVVMLADYDAGVRARASLEERGTDDRDLKLYSAEEIQSNHGEYMARRTAAGKAVGAIIDDAEGRDLYQRYASEGRSAMWVRVDEDGVRSVMSTVADHGPLHVRYYGESGQQDIHLG